MSDALGAVVDRIRERVTPDDDERERLETVVADLRQRLETVVADLEAVDETGVEVVQVGSTARGTWLAGDRDIDLFVCFPPDVERERLESSGLAVGHAVLPDGREEYAEHPYVHGEYAGFEVDLVPCYAVADATEIKSAVDRTPFHTRYLADRLDGRLTGEVRVAKQFCKAAGVYGSDLRTRGLSGYLVELLVLEYGSFRAFVTAVADWHPPIRLDPERHGQVTFDDPLVVVDPTDPERNVAAACSAESVARLQHHAREVLTDPRAEQFERDDPEPVDADAVRAAFRERATTPVALRFEAPDVVDDQLYPQLEKSRQSVAGELERRGFDVLRSAAFATDSAVLLAELEVAERPRVERHEGPPVGVRDHATGFYEAYADRDVWGPFIEGERYVVERERAFATARDLLESEAVFDVALGPDVERALERDYEVLVGDEVATLTGEFGVELARYLDPRP